MLKIGDKVLISSDCQIGKEIFVKEADDSFYLPMELKSMKGKIGIIKQIEVWRTNVETGKPIFYYRVCHDFMEGCFLEEHLKSIDLKDFYLIQLKDGEFIIIQKENFIDVVRFPSFESLDEEIQKKVVIF